MLGKIKTLYGKILCFFGSHDLKKINKKELGIAAVCRCKRKGCDFRIEPIVWPRPLQQQTDKLNWS